MRRLFVVGGGERTAFTMTSDEEVTIAAAIDGFLSIERTRMDKHEIAIVREFQRLLHANTSERNGDGYVIPAIEITEARR